MGATPDGASTLEAINLDVTGVGVRGITGRESQGHHRKELLKSVTLSPNPWDSSFSPKEASLGLVLLPASVSHQIHG